MRKKVWRTLFCVLFFVMLCIPASLSAADDPVTLPYFGTYPDGIDLDADYDLHGVYEDPLTAAIGSALADAAVSASDKPAVWGGNGGYGPWWVTIAEGVLITSDDAGIYFGYGGTVLNSGSIRAFLGEVGTPDLDDVWGLYGVHIEGNAWYTNADLSVVGFTNNAGAIISTTAYLDSDWANQVYGVVVKANAESPGNAESFSNAGTIQTLLDNSTDWAHISMVDGVSIWGDVMGDFTNSNTISTEVTATDHADVKYVYGVRIGGDVAGFYNIGDSWISAMVTVGDYANWWNYVSEVAGVKIIGSVGSDTDNGDTFLNDGLISAYVETGTSTWLPVRKIFGVDIGGDVDTFTNSATGTIRSWVFTDAKGVEDVYGVRIQGDAPSFTNAGTIEAAVSSAGVCTINGDVEDVYGVSIGGDGAGSGADDIVLTADDPALTGAVYGNFVDNSGTITAVVTDSVVDGGCGGGDVEDIYGIAIDGDWAGVGADLFIDTEMTAEGSAVFSITDVVFGNKVVNSGTVGAGVEDSKIYDDVKDIYGISIDGDDAGRWADGTATLTEGTVEAPTTITASGVVFGNEVVNSSALTITAGVIESYVDGDVKRVYGIAIDGDDAGKKADGWATFEAGLTDATTVTVSDVLFGNSVVNSGTILSGVADSDVDCNVEDVYGVFISGDDAGERPEGSAEGDGGLPTLSLDDVVFGNRVVNTGTIEAGVFNSEVDGECCHGGDVEDIYGIAIEGHDAGKGGLADVAGLVFGNIVENSGTVEAGVFAEIAIDGVDIVEVVDDGGDLDIDIESITGGSYVDDDVEDIYGISIDGDNALTNTVNNTSSDTIMAGVFTNVAITNVVIDAVGPGIEIEIPSCQQFNYVGGEVEDVYGVAIDGDQWGCGCGDDTVTNTVDNSGAILAGVITIGTIDVPEPVVPMTVTDVTLTGGWGFVEIEGGVEDIYGVSISGDGALANTVDNSGDIWAGVFQEVTATGVNVATDAPLFFMAFMDGNGRLSLTDIVGDVEDVYGISIGGDGAGKWADVAVNADEPTVTGAVYGNFVDNSGAIMAGVSDSEVNEECWGGDVEDVYGIAIDGDWAGAGADLSIDTTTEDGGLAFSMTDLLFGNKVVNTGTVDAGVTKSEIDDDVEDIYGISIDGDDAGRWADGWATLTEGVEAPTTITASGIVFGNSAVNSSAISAGVTDYSYVGGDVEDVYGIAIDGDDAGKKADGWATLWEGLTAATTATVSDVIFGNKVVNSGTVMAGVSDSYVGCNVEDVYGIFISGDDAGERPEGSAEGDGGLPTLALTDVVFGNKVVNSGTVTAGVVNSLVWGDCCHGGDVEDIYGIAIEGHDAGKGGTNEVAGLAFGNIVENSGAVNAGVFTDLAIDGWTMDMGTFDFTEGTFEGGISYVEDDVKDVYGVSIDGDNALTNRVSNTSSDTIKAGVFMNVAVENITITDTEEPNGGMAALQNGMFDGPTMPYIGGKVKDIYGVAIDGDQWGCGCGDDTVINAVTNSGAIWAGVFSDVLVDISVDIPDYPMPDPEEMPEAMFLGVGDEVKDVYGVAINGNHALTNSVLNSGAIWAGVFADADSAVTVTVNGVLAYTGEIYGYVGDEAKDIYGVAIDGHGAGTGAEDIVLTEDDPVLTGGVFGNTVANSGTIMAGVSHTAVPGDCSGGDVEDVYGIAVDGDWAGVGADILIDASEDGNTAYSITNFLFGNEVMNSGTVTAGAMDSFIGDDVEDIYGISIDGEDAGRWADGSAMLDAGTVEDPTTVALSGIVFGNSIVNSGPVTAGVTDSEVGGNVEDVYGIAVDGDDAGKRAEGCASTSEALTNANTLTVSDVLFGNQVINSGTLLSGVEDSEVGCSVEDVYGIFIKGDEAGAWPEGSADLEGEPAIALTDVLFGNRVVNSGPVTAGVVNSVVWGDCCHGGDVKDIYGIAIEGHEAGQGGTTDVNGFDVVFGNLVENSGTVMAGVFTDATVDGLDVTYIANEGTELVDVVADDMTGGISYVANDVEDVYGVSIDGDNALTNTVSNSGADTIMAGVFTNLTITNITIAEVEPNGIAEPIFPYVGDKVKDVYGVYIDGDQWSCGDVTNTVTNDGAIEAGIFTNVTAGISNSDLEDGPFPEGFWIGGVGDDVRDIYGVYISGNGAEANTVTNDGTITSGIFTDMTVDGEQTPGYVGDDVKHIAGVYISGEASDNLVENSGTITAGVTNTEVAGDVKGVYGVYILGTVAASGANVVENSGTIAAGIESSIVGDDVKHIYGVKIRGDGAELNQVNNDGTITAAVTNTDVADSVEDVYGVYISGVGADSNVVNNSGTIVGDTGIAVVGDADIENSGAVTGTGGTAILLGPGTNLVTLLENSVITGDIDGTTHGGNDTLVLDSDRGFGPDNLIRDQINADQIKGFEDFAKTGPGLWGIGAGENDLAIANSLTITEGTLAIGGNVTAPDYTQTAAGATLGLIVTDDGSAGTLTATNSATLDAVTGSPVLVIPQAGIYGGTTDYGTVIDFDPVVAVNPANLVGFIDEDITSTTVFLIPTLTREDDHYNLTLTESWGVFGEYGSVFESLLPGAPADVQNVIFGLSAAEGKALSEQLGGLIYPNLQGAALSGLSQYFGTLTGRMGGFLVGSTGSTAPTAVMGSMLAMNPDMTMSDAGRNLILAAAAQTARQQAPQEYKTDWGFWSQVYGGWGENDGSNIASMYDYDTRGISLGFDKKFGRNLLFGVAFGYSYTKVEMDTLSNEVEIDGFHGSLYGTINFDPWYLKGILSYERSDYESTRNITLLGLVANGDYSGDIFSGYLEAGYIYKLDKTLDIIPMVSIQGSDVSTDGFTETGAGAFNLHVSDDSDSSIVSTVGLKVRKVFTTATGTRVIPEFGARWAHEFSSDEYTMNANFPGSTGSAFAVKGEGPAENAALLGVGLTTDFTNNLSLYLIYDLSLSDDLTEHKGTVGLRYTW